MSIYIYQLIESTNQFEFDDITEKLEHGIVVDGNYIVKADDPIGGIKTILKNNFDIAINGVVKDVDLSSDITIKEEF